MTIKIEVPDKHAADITSLCERLSAAARRGGFPISKDPFNILGPMLHSILQHYVKQAENMWPENPEQN